MFGLEYLLSMVSVFFNLGIAIIWAIPVNIIWSRIGRIYFGFLPEIWLEIPYWHIVGLTMICFFIGSRIKSLVPTIVKVENNQEINKENTENGN